MIGTEDLALLVWYAGIAAVVVGFYLFFLMLADAATLSMSGSFTGQGSWNMTVQGDLIAANISSSGWEIIAGGMI